MNFNLFFNLVSYAVVVSGVLSLWVTGGVGPLTGALFLIAALLAWRAEGGRWQISERVGTVIVVAAVPLAFFAWRTGLIGAGGSALAGLLGQLIIGLSVVKLFQRKTDRDWVFLYLMSFFEVLLAAGVTISPVYLASLLVYLLVAVCAVLVYEMRRSANRAGRDNFVESRLGVRRIPSAALLISFLILIVATPLFFALPRVGGAGFFTTRDGIATRTGFSDSVELGEIGRIQQDDKVVMRVRVEGPLPDGRPLRWRGVALDFFDNRTWRSSKPFTDPPYVKVDRDYFLVNFASGKGPLVPQTFYLEPLDTPVLFALGRPVAVTGSFDTLFKNTDDNLKFPRRAFERVVYKVGSDPYLPSTDSLEDDRAPDPVVMSRFLQTPQNMDSRIAGLAEQIVRSGGSGTRYGAALAIESYLREGYGYTLEMKARGDQPVADFLFNVREGHCEYFASAMVLMLRSQGIAARVVNGFQQGEYNETADVFVVRQRDAHSWVEVYFPEEGYWVPFDPTPAAGQPVYGNSGIVAGLNRYLEALETFWIQYFVAYDDQEQRSLVRSVRGGVDDYQSRISDALGRYTDGVQAWWSALSGGEGLPGILKAVGVGLGVVIGSVVLLMVAGRVFGSAARRGMLGRLLALFGRGRGASAVEFYERMTRGLSRRGLTRRPAQTPLEFAESTGIVEVVLLTRCYNQVRFGGSELGADERASVEAWLRNLEARDS